MFEELKRSVAWTGSKERACAQSSTGRYGVCIWRTVYHKRREAVNVVFLTREKRSYYLLSRETKIIKLRFVP